MRRLFDLIKRSDPSIYATLVEQNMKPEYFAFRWLTLILSQEFPLPDVISLWDCIFAERKLFDFLLFVCCSMITYTHIHTNLFVFYDYVK